MDAGIFELLLLYVLSAIATFWFLRDRVRRSGKKFPVRFSIFAALLWPAPLFYATIKEFTKGA